MFTLMTRPPPPSPLFPYTTLFRSTVNTTGYIDHSAFLGTINPDTNKIPKHLFQGYLNIYNNYFKAPWMPDRTEANPNELNQDDARYGFLCCHLKNIDRKSGSAGMPRPISYAVFCLKKKIIKK